MKKLGIVIFMLFIALSSVAFAQQSQVRRMPTMMKTSAGLPGKSTTAYGWHGGAATAPALGKNKVTSATKPNTGKVMWSGQLPKIDGRTGFSRNTPNPAPKSRVVQASQNAVTGSLVRRPISQLRNRARFAQSSSTASRSSESSSSSASQAFEGSATSGQTVGGGSNPSNGAGSTAPRPS